MRKYFHIFLGAVVIRNGLPSIQAWISALIDWSLPSATNVAFGDSVTDVAVDVSPFFPLSDPFLLILKELMVR
jgi:hypothetical protein